MANRPTSRIANGFTLRAFGVGALFSFFLNAASSYTYLVMHTAGMSSDFITAGAIFLFFVLVGGINTGLRGVKKSWALSTPELILVYIMMIVASVLPSEGLVANLLPIMTGAFYYATPENQWAELIHPYLPDWLVVRDPPASKYFYEGAPSDLSVPWGIWVRALLPWVALTFAVYFVMICIMIILRRQWVERERLVFPLTKLPLEMVEEGDGNAILRPFLRNRLMWVGFAIPFVFMSLTALHNYFPFFRPLSMLKVFALFRRTVLLRVFVSFAVMGLTYFLNVEVAFSLWFFHILARVQTGVFGILGFHLKGRHEVFCGSSPSVAYQGMGAMIVLVAYGLWMARGYLREVFKKAFTGKSDLDDSEEVLSYRTAVFGTIGGLFFISVWLKMSGIPLFVIPIFLVAAFIIFIGLARIVAEGGVGFARAQMIPQPLAVYAVGTDVLSPRALVGLGLTYSWAADVRTTVMASSMNSFKLAEAIGMKRRPLFGAMMLAIAVGLLGSIWMTLRLAYRYGGINLESWFFGGMPRTVFDFVADKLNNPIHLSMTVGRWAFTGIGALGMGMLMFMRHRFLWWPIHYLGFPIGDTWVMEWVWFSVFLGWLLKSVMLKYGGAPLYRWCMPFFLGLVLGHLSCVGTWMIIDFFTGTTENYIHIGAP